MIKNEYRYTPEASKEVISAWYHKKLGYTEIMLVAVIFFEFAVFVKSQSYLNLVVGVLAILGITLFWIKRSKLIKMERDRLEVLYHDEPPTVVVELADMIYYATGGNERNIEYSNIQKVIKSKNFIVLMLKGEVTIALSKAGFVEGTEEECLNFLKKKILENKGRRK